MFQCISSVFGLRRIGNSAISNLDMKHNSDCKAALGFPRIVTEVRTEETQSVFWPSYSKGSRAEFGFLNFAVKENFYPLCCFLTRSIYINRITTDSAISVFIYRLHICLVAAFKGKK